MCAGFEESNPRLTAQEHCNQLKLGAPFSFSDVHAGLLSVFTDTRLLHGVSEQSSGNGNSNVCMNYAIDGLI